MTTRPGLSTLAIAAALLLCVFAGPAGAFSGDAGGGFRYEGFELTADRNLAGFIVNTENRTRRNVRVTITAIGEESGAPLWSTRQNLGTMSPGERKPIDASYGRFTADPGSFTFEFTEEGAVEMQPQDEEPEANADDTNEEGAPSGALQERNACSRIENTLRGKEVSGSGECGTVSFKLFEGSARFSVYYTPSDPITVQLLNEDGKPLDFLFELLTYSTGSKRIDVEEEGVYSLQVLAAGEWSVRIQQQNGDQTGDNGTQRPARRFDMDSKDDGSLSITNY
ncbi:hypothetical protein DPQ33_03555 [Oceanidesulfovibrio indonesiensis]|uniref:Uncharacterized protein n=1 Tax=Oceanidesulfovibrio indonesiensis TaxID=54767 RepID=A0A7M3MJ11_9BACT|nr:hypothetical protein [Oceanidesulfovibrio indonesiensis]TVM19447.1 hypothetical protein DPQ33_03555 [Oceanidesulfovibrio indonesiensis]